jgi:IPT/TIG domain
VISSLSPARPRCGEPLTIRGERFGSNRKDVDGQVRIDGEDASIDAWSMTEIQVSVPQSVRGGNSRLLEVVVSGRTASKEIAITC